MAGAPPLPRHVLGTVTWLDLISRGLGHSLEVQAGSPCNPGRARGEGGENGEEATESRDKSVSG